MTANGLPAFDKTLQTTNIWLNEISEKLGPDRQVAWKVLSTVLHKLRDRLPVDAAAHLGAQLPLLEGVYGGDFEALFAVAYTAAIVASYVFNMLFIEIYLRRKGSRGISAGAV